MKDTSLISLFILSWSAFFGASSHAATVDGQPNIGSSAPTGLYVWRNWSGADDWQVRLIAGGSSGESFEGQFEGSGIGSTGGIALESGDSASLSGASHYIVDFSVQRQDIDGAKFSVASGSNLCLRSLGTGMTVYLGKNAVPVSTPVALSGSDACASGSGPAEDGLYFSQGSSGNWEARLLSENGRVTFDGVFETTQPIVSFEGYKLESSDIAQLQSPDELAVSLAVIKGGIDGVDFVVPSGSGVCIRDTTGSASVVYLGTGPADAVPVATPADLTNSGACDGSTIDPPPPPVTSDRKFNPGHYVALMRGNDSQNTMASSIKAGVKGFMKRYTWRELEPSKNQYDFSEIVSDLDFLSSQGMHLVVMVEDKTFVNEQPLPQYLAAKTVRNKSGGYTAVRWDSTIVNRMSALFEALGSRFDSNAYFEGIGIQESAPSLNDSTLDSSAYTPEKYRDALIDVLSAGATGAPTSRMFWYMNFLPRKQAYIADVANAVAPIGVVMGGPDVMPDQAALQRLTYPFYAQFSGKMPLFGQVEPICYSHLHTDTSFATKYWTMSELFHYARDNLDVNYMFWVRYPKADYYNSYDWFDTLPVMENNPVFNQ